MWRIASLLLVVASACGFEGETPVLPDAPTVSFEFPTSNTDETSVGLSVRLLLDHPYDLPVSVTYTIDDSTTALPEDYTIADPSPRITFQPGSTEHTILFTIVKDDLEERDEKIDLTLTNPEGLKIAAKMRHTIQISNDILPRARFSTATSTLPEDGPADIAVTLDKVSEVDVSVTVQIVANETTASADDHTLPTATTITIPAGASGANIPFPITADALDEDEEDISLALGAPSPGVIITEVDASKRLHTIMDDDAEPSVGFIEATSSGNEGTDFGFVVQLSAPSGRTITVPFMRSGNADNSQDAELLTTTTTLTFAPGVMEQTITFDSKPDGDLDEEDEQVIVTLGTPTNATLGTATRTHTLLDQDPTPTITFLSGAMLDLDERDPGDNADFISYGIDINGSSSRTITITVTFTAATTNGAVFDTDYTVNPDPVTFSIPPGDSLQRSFRVTVVNDNDNENDETFTMDLGTPTNANRGTFPMRNVRIRDDD